MSAADIVAIFGTITHVLQPVALAVASISLPVLPAAILRLHKAFTDAQQASALDTTLTDAAHGMYGYFVTNKRAIDDRQALATALADAIRHVIEFAPNEVGSQGLSADDLGKLISNRFAAVLVADPSISITASASVVPLRPDTMARTLPRTT